MLACRAAEGNARDDSQGFDSATRIHFQLDRQSTCSCRPASVRCMKTLAQLISPVSSETFYANHHDRSPLHIPASEGADKAKLFGWGEFNRLLDQTGHWTSETLRMIHDTRNVDPTQYCRQNASGTHLIPDPRKVQLQLARGSSLVANDLEDMSLPVARLAAGLSSEFAARIGANVYSSFKGVRAFGPHFDLHHVFAVQIEGEKLWRLYKNRMPDPVDMPVQGPDLPLWFQRNCGPVMQEVRMKPGDVLYLPRGWFHDALAEDGASLHVTFSVAPLYGRILFKLLESAAMQDPAFRKYFPPVEQAGGKALQQHLGHLGQKLAALCALPDFLDEVAMTQNRLRPRTGEYSLPAQMELTRYRVQPIAAPAFSGPVAHAMHYAYSRSEFVLEEVIALFDFVSETDIRTAVDRAAASGSLIKL